MFLIHDYFFARTLDKVRPRGVVAFISSKGTMDKENPAESRIKGMIAIRDCVRTLIEYQTEDYPVTDIQAEQEKLNGLYDDFSKKYGMINARANNSAFSSDSSYCLLSSLEVLDDEGTFRSGACPHRLHAENGRRN